MVGTHSSGEHAKRGSAARDLELFRQAVGTAYQPAQVCLFDAIEELARLRESLAAEAAQEGAGTGTVTGSVTGLDSSGTQEAASTDTADTLSSQAQGQDRGQGQSRAWGQARAQEALPAGPEPRWVLSDPVTEMKSTFVARCARVTSAAEASRFVEHLVATDRRVRSATHNMTAWRIRGPGGASFQDCDDDGETAAGGRLLHLMQLMDLWDTMVVVTRWYGGQKLGPRRFAVINQAARDAFDKAGLIAETPAKKKHGK